MVRSILDVVQAPFSRRASDRPDALEPVLTVSVTISLAIVTYNDERDVASLIDSVRPACDETVVVDTGSSDHTMTVAGAHGAKVQEVTWRNDFAAARNAAFAWCSCDWILWLEPGDQVPMSTVAALHQFKGWLHDGVDAIVSPHQYEFSRNGDVLTSENRVRLLRRESGLRWSGRVHESVTVEPGHFALAPELVVDRTRRVAPDERVAEIMQSELASSFPSADIRFYNALELYDAHKFDEAAGAFRAFLSHRGDGSHQRYWVLLCLSECGRAMGDLEMVRAAAIEAIGLDPGRAEAYVSLGRTYYEREQWDQAVPLLVAATAGRPPHLGHVRVGDYRFAAWDYLSICYDRLGRRNEALNAAARAIAGNPEAERVRSNMRWMIDHL